MEKKHRLVGIVMLVFLVVTLGACSGEGLALDVMDQRSKSDAGALLTGEMEGNRGAALTFDGQSVKLSGKTYFDDNEREEISFVGTVESISNDLWMVQGRELTIASETNNDDLIVVGDLVEVHAALGNGDVLLAVEIELVSNDDDHDYDHDDDQYEIEFYGIVDAFSDVEWLIDGRTVIVTEDTEIDGGIVVGDYVQVEAYENSDGSLVAHEIELEDSDLDMDDDDYDDDAYDDDAYDDDAYDDDHDDDHDDDDDDDEYDDDDDENDD